MIERESLDGFSTEATVGNVIRSGKKPYLVAYPRDATLLPEGKAVTCSIDGWKGHSPPQKGQVITLDGVQEYARGWRAQRASPKKLK